MSSSPPLVSCVMPTADRPRWVSQAIHYFERQDYPNRELVILDDGERDVSDLVPVDPRIRYKRLHGKRTLGAKQNLCVAESRGDLILHWDDDDWFAPHRISSQVDAMLRDGSEICGLPAMLFHELRTGRTWRYELQAGPGRHWLAGGSLLYTKDFWSRSPFPDRQVGADTSFVWSQSLAGAATLADDEIYVAMIHDQNSSPKIVQPNWTPWHGDLPRIMGDDFGFYEFARESPRPRTSNADAPGLVDVILPRQASAENLRRCIATIEAQTYRPIRLTIDDTDARPPRNPEVDGEGEYLLVLETGCLLYPDAIGALVRALAAKPESAYAYGGFLSRESRGDPRSSGTMALLRRSALPRFDVPLERLPGRELWIMRLCEDQPGAWCGEVLFEKCAVAAQVTHD